MQKISHFIISVDDEHQ